MSTDAISLVTIIALIRKEIAESRGTPGKDGKQGGTGERGAKGDTGPQGKAGPKGGDGKQGKAGKDGKDGKDGKGAEEAVGIANIEQDVDDAIIITMTDGETYTIEMPLGKNTEVHYKVGGGSSGGGESGSVDLSGYVEKPTSNTAWMVYKKGAPNKGWSPVTTDLVATNPDVLFRDSKGRFKSTDTVPDLKNQLEVNRWFLEQIEAIEAGELELPEMTNDWTPNTLALRDSNGNAKFTQLTVKNITFSQNSVSTNMADTWFLSGGEQSAHGIKKNDAEGMRSSLNIYSKDEVDALSGGGEEALTYQIQTDKILRSGEAAIELVASDRSYTNVKFVGENGISVYSDFEGININGAGLATHNEVLVEVGKEATQRSDVDSYLDQKIDANSFFTDLGNSTIQYFGNELQVTMMNDPFHVGAKLGNDISCSGRFISGTECFVGGSIGLKFDSNSNSVVPVDEMGRPKVGIDLGSTAAKFKDGDFTGEVRATAFVGDGSQLTGTVSTKAIVDAFQSIQMAVSNETTVAGIKKALTNSLGGLIEKLEG
jgi:hypothetical protein